MFRDPDKDRPQQVTLNCLIADGGVGDLIASLVAVDYILKNYKWVDLLIWVPDYLKDFAKNVLPGNANIFNFTTASNKYNNKLPGVSTKWVSQHTPMKTHPVDYAFHMLCDEHVDYKDKNYLKVKFDKVNINKFNLPDKYVVFPVGASARTKELPVEVVNKLSSYVKDKGFTPVFVGKSEESVGYGDIKMEAKLLKVDTSLGLDLTNQTNLLELAKIIQNSAAVCGMDGGVMHLAGCTDAKIVVGFTFVRPEQIMPIRNDQLGYNCYPIGQPESLKCRYCQSKMNYVYDHDFRNCYYDDYQCVKNLTADKFIEQLEKIL